MGNKISLSQQDEFRFRGARPWVGNDCIRNVAATLRWVHKLVYRAEKLLLQDCVKRLLMLLWVVISVSNTNLFTALLTSTGMRTTASQTRNCSLSRRATALFWWLLVGYQRRPDRRICGKRCNSPARLLEWRRLVPANLIHIDKSIGCRTIYYKSDRGGSQTVKFQEWVWDAELWYHRSTLLFTVLLLMTVAFSDKWRMVLVDRITYRLRDQFEGRY